MKRSITYHDVEEAAQKIIDQGEWPTVATVRTVLGRGSFSTIQKFLQSWQQRFLDASRIRTQIPNSLVYLIENLYLDIEKKVAARYEQEIRDLRDENEALRRDIEVFKELLKQQPLQSMPEE